MKQLALFDEDGGHLDTLVTRDGNVLRIPESINTIPCTHGIHRFPGKFIPNIPRYVMRELLPSDDCRIILDPFCGSGTTLVEAALQGREFIGVDIDPLAVLIASVKTQPLTEGEVEFLAGFWGNHDYGREEPDLIPLVPNLSHWFSDRTIVELSSVKKRCLELPEALRAFSLVVFSSIVRRVSNADDQTQKTYVSHTLPKKPPAPSELFPLYLTRAIQGMKGYVKLLPKSPLGRIMRADARRGISELQFHDVLTSPPYIDSIDYIYNQTLEYFWLMNELGVPSYDCLRQLRRQPMGLTEELSSDAIPAMGSCAEFEAMCLDIGRISQKEERRVRAFFADYATHAREAHQRQNGVKGLYVCVVGNSRIRGVTVPTSEIIAGIHCALGYRLRERLTYEIRRHYMKFPRRGNSGKISQDHILVFEV